MISWLRNVFLFIPHAQNKYITSQKEPQNENFNYKNKSLVSTIPLMVEQN